MKTPKSSDSEEITPSKKILKQARLPFRAISDVSPKSDIPQSRKRKLSVPESVPVTKVGKISKKTDLQELVVISDDDSNSASDAQKMPVKLNPFVKLVDTAYKKKLQKTKGAKKRKGGANKTKTVNGSLENIENSCNNTLKCDVKSIEEMEVDIGEDVEKEGLNESSEMTEKNTVEEKPNDTVEVEKSDEETVALDSTVSNNDGCQESSKSPLAKNNENCTEDEENKEQGDESKEENEEETSVESKSPKRSDKIKSKGEDKHLDTSHNCDESLSSDPSTPRRSNRKVSLTNSQGDVSLTESNNTNLTPKQIQKKQESAKRKEDKEKERLEREKKKLLEKEERERQKREKDDQKKREREEKEEARKKEKEEKEEQRRKEKEDKEKQKELEKKMREEKEEQKRKEKEEKEEQRRKEKEARDEEKKKKQEALEQEKLEQEQKKKKAAEAFVSFFVPKQKVEKDQLTVGDFSKNNMLSSFTIKSDMRLAPTIRVRLNDDNRKCLDNLLNKQSVPETSLYIKSLKDGSRKPLVNGKTWPLSDKGGEENDDDVMIVEDELPPVDGVGEIIACEAVTQEKLRPKLLAFHDNRRPPYWGTWRKKSSCIKPKQPFNTDTKLLDYEVDSDDDWEEEQDGESIDGSAAGSEDEQDADEYEVDNELFVPHGYLSDEEATMDEDDVLSLSPETQKARLKHLEDEFESEMKKPTEKLKPWLYGLSWENKDGEKPENCTDALWSYLEKLSMIMDDPSPLLQPSNESEEPEKKKVKRKKANEGDQHSPKTEKKKKPKTEEKEKKKQKVDNKKNIQEPLKNQPGINTFLTKLKSS